MQTPSVVTNRLDNIVLVRYEVLAEVSIRARPGMFRLVWSGLVWYSTVHSITYKKMTLFRLDLICICKK
jgi:hypothetical protein